MSASAVQPSSTVPAASRPRWMLPVLVLLLAAGSVPMVLFFLGSREAPAAPLHPAIKLFFMNERTGEVVVRTADEAPPLVDAQGRPVLVRAIFYSADGGKSRKLAYLLRYTPGAQRAYQEIRTDSSAAASPELQGCLDAGTLVRLPAAGAAWVRLDSSAGSAVAAAALRQFPAGAAVRQCFPE